MDSTDALLTRAFEAAVAAADPISVLAPHWPDPPKGRLIVQALGKASIAMASAAVEHYAPMGVRCEGAVVTPHGSDGRVDALERFEAGHPTPDAASERAGERLLALARTAGEDDLVLLLISGGGSALATTPRGVVLSDLVDLTRTLLAWGVPIDEMNRVRRRLDRVKAGGIAYAAHPARTVALVVSDVVGDDPIDIASGPASADPDGPDRAVSVLERHGIELPPVRAQLAAEQADPTQGPPRPDDPRLERSEVRIVASAARSLEAARQTLADAGYHAHVTSDVVTGDAREAGRALADEVKRLLESGRLADGTSLGLPAALVSGGETTVAVHGDGRGGPNSTFALAFAQELPPDAPVRALIADSDGVDGLGGHAGAFVRPDLFDRLERDRAAALDRNDDSYRAFSEADALFAPGPTGTNVNDVRIVLVDAQASEARR